MPLTEKGFERLTFDECLDIWIDRAKLMFGDDIDTSNQSVIGKYLRLFCEGMAENGELAEKAYLSSFPNTAEGVSLDRLCSIAGITRNPATYARHKVTLNGIAGETVEMGFLVSNGKVVFHTIDDYTIGDNEKVEAIVECNESGTIGNVDVGSIKTIVNPSMYVSSIKHDAIVEIANDAESDYSVRQRFTPAMANRGKGTIDSIRASILSVSGVEDVKLLENSTNATDANGVPPHSIRAYVLAPTTSEQQIGYAILDSKAAGIGTDGTKTTVVQDTGGWNHSIKFSFVSHVVINVKCTVSVTSEFSDESIQQIKYSVVDKIAKHRIGQDLTATSLYSAIYVDGVSDVTSLEIGTGGVYSTSSIKINDNQVARAVAENIEVTVS